MCIPDLHLVLAILPLLDIDVDREVGVDVTHLVEEALGDANDHVVDDRADGPQGGDRLAPAMVQLDRDDALLRAAEGHVDVRQVLGKLAPGALNGDDPRADVDAHYWRIPSQYLRCVYFNASMLVVPGHVMPRWVSDPRQFLTPNRPDHYWRPHSAAQKNELPIERRKYLLVLRFSCHIHHCSPPILQRTPHVQERTAAASS